MKRWFFKKKVRKTKHNKFFSYKNEERRKRNFRYKNFEKSNSYNTRFTASNFNFVNFKKATMKYCGFNGAEFEGTEFKSSNLRGSRFIGAAFKDTLFYDTKLHNVNFKNAKFENVIFVCSSIKDARGITKSTAGITFYSSLPSIDISDNLKKAIKYAQNNKYIRNSEVLCFFKKEKINTINIKKLLDNFNENKLTIALIKASKLINKDFYTLSYLNKFIMTYK